jgi:hypothetical protein
MTRKEALLCLISIGAGVAAVNAAIIKPEAALVDWDWYKAVATPLLCALAATLGFLEPRHAWRWGLLPIIVVPPWIFWRSGGNGALWPIFALTFLYWAIVPIICAYVGVLVRLWLGRRPSA